jgi:hypothetical protein
MAVSVVNQNQQAVNIVFTLIRFNRFIRSRSVHREHLASLIDAVGDFNKSATMDSYSSSLSVLTPRALALSSLLPALAPTMSRSVFFDTLEPTLAPMLNR